MTPAPAKQTAVADRLAASNPSQTIASLQASLRTSHNLDVKMRTTVGGATEISVTPGETPNFPAAIRAVELSLTPLPISRVQEALAELDTITSRRKGDAIDMAMTMSAYTKRVEAYPGDVVLDVIANWSSQWWPSWEELRARLEMHTIPRRALIHRLRKAQKDRDAKVNRKPPATLEQRQAIMRELKFTPQRELPASEVTAAPKPPSPPALAKARDNNHRIAAARADRR